LKNTVFWDVFTAVSMKDIFWDKANNLHLKATAQRLDVLPSQQGFNGLMKSYLLTIKY
jgi:hypothetical protein